MKIVDRFKDFGRNVFSPLTDFLAKKNVSPNLITLLGIIPSVCSLLFYFKGNFVFGAIFIAIAGIFDILDGQLARKEKRVTEGGAYLDSNLDRVSDFIPMFGIAVYYMRYNHFFASLTFILMFGAFMVSYSRARAESFGIDCRVGIADRTFRMIFLIIGSLFGPTIFVWFLGFLILATYATFIVRIVYSFKKL